MYDTQDDEAFTHPTLEYLQRAPRIVYEILPSLSPHEPRPYTCGWPGAQTCHVHPSLPLPSSSIAAGLSSLSMPLHSTGASLGPQLFRAPVPLLWLYLPGRSLSTTTMLSNHRDPGGDRLVSFLLVSLRSVEYLSTPAVLKAR